MISILGKSIHLLVIGCPGDPLDIIKDDLASMIEKISISTSLKDAEISMRIEPANLAIILGSAGKSFILESVLKLREIDLALPIILVLKNEGDLENLDISKVELTSLNLNHVFSISKLSTELQDYFRRDTKSEKLWTQSKTTSDISVQDDKLYFAVPTSSFIPDTEIFFDTHVKLKENRYVKILQKGDAFSVEMLSRFTMQKQIKNFYFLEIERKKYINYCNKLIQLSTSGLGTVKMTDNQKLNTLKSGVESYIEQIFTDGLNPDAIYLGKSVTENIYGIISNQNELQEMFIKLGEFDPGAFTHAFLVTFLSNSVASRFDWYSKLNAEILSLAAMFHDIGKIKLPKELLTKRPFSMTAEEIKIYEKHSSYGAEILNEKKYISPTICQIVLEHHEAHDGSGFPLQRQGNRLLAMSKVLHFADLIAHMMQAKKINAIEALSLLSKDPLTHRQFHPEVYLAFQEICKV